jgi:hypothetical protein
MKVDGIAWNRSLTSTCTIKSQIKVVFHKERPMIRAWPCIRSHCVARILDMGTMQHYLSPLVGNENAYSFPYTFHGSSSAPHKASGTLALFPSQSKIFAKVHVTERFASLTISAPDGLHSDESSCAQLTLSPIVAGEIQI